MIALRFFGTTAVTVRGPDRVLADLRDLWAPFVPPEAHPVRSAHALEVSDALSGTAMLNRLAVDVCPHPAVHAGVVGVRGGAAALPARSGDGKSTLVTALCRHGAGYVSDEALVLSVDGVALPYPKPVALSRESVRALGVQPARVGPPDPDEHLMAGRQVGPLVTRPLPVRHVVLLDRRTARPAQCVGDADDVRLVPIPSREGLGRLLELGFNHYRDPRCFLEAAAAAVAGAQVWRLTYRDAHSAAALMMNVLGHPGRPERGAHGAEH